MGVMLVFFAPMPYVDAIASSWSFRERRKRVLVGAAGMIVELFVVRVGNVRLGQDRAGHAAQSGLQR